MNEWMNNVVYLRLVYTQPRKTANPLARFFVGAGDEMFWNYLVVVQLGDVLKSTELYTSKLYTTFMVCELYLN